MGSFVIYLSLVSTMCDHPWDLEYWGRRRHSYLSASQEIISVFYNINLDLEMPKREKEGNQKHTDFLPSRLVGGFRSSDFQAPRQANKSVLVLEVSFGSFKQSQQVCIGDMLINFRIFSTICN